ncbi:polycomb group protein VERNALIZATION 2-like isoform X2 [Raphanus sativus]|uniref:Polycomb group protein VERNALIZATION 2-like isoform X2 n=1 Tax=Raphanus sativus TaxID=3726 RepID=A0A9W3C8P4_RAPSA|nr:polycomb group protein VERNALIZATION 2-like isoform X2 [Raphanus sativus]
MFCSSNRFKHRQIGGRKLPKRLNVTILPMDHPFLADVNGTSQLNNGNPVAMMNVPDIGQSSGSGASESEGPAAKTRKLSDGTSEARSISLLQTRQLLYHSRTLQAPMTTLEEVMSDRDSEDEVDEDEADSSDRHMIDDCEDLSPTTKEFIHLWHSFVRKQRVTKDGHVPWGCEAFSKFHKKEFFESKPLHSCWRMFMIEVLEDDLLDAVTVNKCNLIIKDSEDDHSDNTNNSNSVDYDVDNNGVDLSIDLERNSAMDVNNNSVDRGIDLNRNVTMNVNTGSVDRRIDLNRNDVMDVNDS